VTLLPGETLDKPSAPLYTQGRSADLCRKHKKGTQQYGTAS
jgi:hypothetical protein